MKKFYQKNKKKIKISLIIFFIILIIVLLWLFILPGFNKNKYGDRLKDITKHKISSEVISKIKDKSKDNDSVVKIDYHKEGKILNFIITVDSNFGVDQAKEFASSILEEIADEDEKYYDIQFLIDSNEDSDNYPIIGYKNKNNDNINFGNVGA